MAFKIQSQSHFELEVTTKLVNMLWGAIEAYDLLKTKGHISANYNSRQQFIRDYLQTKGIDDANARYIVKIYSRKNALKQKEFKKMLESIKRSISLKDTE